MEGSLLLFEVLHFRGSNLVLHAKFSIEANFHFHICLSLENGYFKNLKL